MKGLLASLPMYDWPEVQWAADALWAALRDRLRALGLAAPDAVLRGGDHTRPWREPALIFSQTCGYPYVMQLRGRVQLVATPCYGAPGCTGATYRSVILVRRDSPWRDISGLEGASATANSEDSQSGYSALRAVVAPHARRGRFFGRVVLSGSHRDSLRMVARGEADVCAIDAVCMALARRHEREAIRRVRIIARSPRAPALPFITAGGRSSADLALIRHALFDVLADRALAAAREAMFLDGAEVLDDRAYDRIAAIERKAVVLGYPKLA